MNRRKRCELARIPEKLRERLRSYSRLLAPVWICLMAVILSLAGCRGTAGEDEKSWKSKTDWSRELTRTGQLELQYAENFAVDFYEGGYAGIQIMDGSSFLVVPEGGTVPEDLPEDVAVLQQPLVNVYLVATAAMDMFRELDALSSIRFSGTAAQGWYIPQAREAMERGDILYAGKYSEPDYEKILAEGCSLAVENTMINHVPEVREKLEQFGIPVLVDYSSYETHPLGRAEWIRLYGVLTGNREGAEQAFAAQNEAFMRVEQLQSAEPGQLESDRGESGQQGSGRRPVVAFFYVTANGSVSVRKASDYVAELIEMAGGRYLFEDLGAGKGRSSSVTMQMEEFYSAAKEADYMIYNSTVDGELQTVKELVDMAPVLADCRAVQEGNVWCTTKNLYQESLSAGPMLEDIYGMLEEKRERGRYLYRLREE